MMLFWHSFHTEDGASFIKKKKVPWSYIMSLGQGMIIVCTVMLTMAYLTLFPFPLSLFLGKRKIDMFFQLGLG